jgi:MFS family permease
MSGNMLPRFSLYGFLKNQKYYEPFLILAFRDKGLSFFTIGLLIGFRMVWINLLEIPSGLIADTYGRRRSMIASFSAYIISFMIFALSSVLWTLFAAMFFFAIGEAFRTGTHKAMIFDWLDSQGRTKEKTRFYGLTRSWSQIGSAVSVVLATAAVLITQNYTAIFWLSIIPYLANIINFLGYPSHLEGKISSDLSPADLWRRLFSTLADSYRNRPLRRLFAESMVFKGNTTITKDYLQPLLKHSALALPFLLAFSDKRRSAVLVGGVYFVLYFISSYASRHSHRIADRLGGAESASRRLWIITVSIFSISAAGIWMHLEILVITGFVAIVILQNIWRPILMTRIDTVSDAAMGATTLSIDSQASSFYVMISAPLMGLAVDAAGLWPVAVFGALMAFVMLLSGKKDK